MSTHQIKSEITGSVWKILKNVGDTVSEEDVIMILESMKMEIPVMADEEGTITEICVAEGASIAEGHVVAILAL